MKLHKTRMPQLQLVYKAREPDERGGLHVIRRTRAKGKVMEVKVPAFGTGKAAEVLIEVNRSTRPNGHFYHYNKVTACMDRDDFVGLTIDMNCLGIGVDLGKEIKGKEVLSRWEVGYGRGPPFLMWRLAGLSAAKGRDG